MCSRRQLRRVCPTHSHESWYIPTTLSISEANPGHSRGLPSQITTCWSMARERYVCVRVCVCACACVCVCGCAYVRLYVTTGEASFRADCGVPMLVHPTFLGHPGRTLAAACTICFKSSSLNLTQHKLIFSCLPPSRLGFGRIVIPAQAEEVQIDCWITVVYIGVGRKRRGCGPRADRYICAAHADLHGYPTVAYPSPVRLQVVLPV